MKFEKPEFRRVLGKKNDKKKEVSKKKNVSKFNIKTKKVGEYGVFKEIKKEDYGDATSDIKRVEPTLIIEDEKTREEKKEVESKGEEKEPLVTVMSPDKGNKSILENGILAGIKEDKFNIKKADFYVKSPLDKTLTIILLEESAEVGSYANTIREGINRLVKRCRTRCDFLCVIKYGESVEVSDVKHASEFEPFVFEIKNGFKNTEVCFYDAIYSLCDVINENKDRIFDIVFERYKIVNFEIIGFGTGENKSSSIDFNLVAKRFAKILNMGIKSKYFCIRDVHMLNVSAMGFRSIATLSK